MAEDAGMEGFREAPYKSLIRRLKIMCIRKS